MATRRRTKRRGPKRRASKKSMRRASRKSAKRSGKRKSGKRRSGKKNAFFSLMLAAKKKDAPSFVYNGKTYRQKKKGHLVFYKA